MWDAITNGISNMAENFADLGARVGESIGLVDKEPAYVSMRDGKLRHNIDLEGYSPEERDQAEAILRSVAEEKQAIKQELAAGTGPEREQLLEARLSELETQLVDVKWELEHQQFSYGKAFFGSLIPGGGVIAQGIGLDADKRLQSAVDILTPSAEEVGATVGESGSGDSSEGTVSGASAGNDVEALMNLMTRDPDAFMDHMSTLDGDERNHLMTVIQANLQEANQMFSMMSNFQKALHDTQKAVINNFRV